MLTSSCSVRIQWFFFILRSTYRLEFLMGEWQDKADLLRRLKELDRPVSAGTTTSSNAPPTETIPIGTKIQSSTASGSQPGQSQSVGRLGYPPSETRSLSPSRQSMTSESGGTATESVQQSTTKTCGKANTMVIRNAFGCCVSLLNDDSCNSLSQITPSDFPRHLLSESTSESSRTCSSMASEP